MQYPVNQILTLVTLGSLLLIPLAVGRENQVEVPESIETEVNPKSGARAQARHDSNPIAGPSTPPRRYSYSDFQYPKAGDRIRLNGLSLTRFRGPAPLDNKWAVAIAELMSTNPPASLSNPKPPDWVPANGAVLYRSFVFRVEGLEPGAVFNNNTDKVTDSRAWTWIRYKRASTNTVTVCYTSRGMIVTPDMPQKGMSPIAIK